MSYYKRTRVILGPAPDILARYQFQLGWVKAGWQMYGPVTILYRDPSGQVRPLADRKAETMDALK